ncbi:carboxymuconolactone decarboxylase family protein [Caballeronia ptereochthonis]|uniref:Alkylhydroperoxidase n=1 Tax=Caballeronia ptereochthonis TaxID=1777144 RepID=A0A158AIV9_9BURK|nr:carboxymuconolactone decarboxylase family protein [Caballeronia ptereochthonis]SAK57758.1 alkylhydroperoxidase [Caballeronia ptereochthonis]
MTFFESFTIDTAPAESKPILEEAKRTFGFVPNLQAHMAESPELLAGYTALWDLFAKSTLTPHEQQVVYLTSNFENDCHYCMAGHSTLAKMIKMEPAVIAALRAGTALPDAKLEALHRFTTIVVRERGFVPEAEVDIFLAAGYTRRNVLEVVLGVATKVMSNYTNHIVHTPYDAFMKGNEWTKPEHVSGKQSAA